MSPNSQATPTRSFSSHPEMSSPASPGKLISAVREHKLSNMHPSARRFSTVVGAKDVSASPRTTGGTLSQRSLGTRSLSVLPKSYAGNTLYKSSNASSHVSGPGSQVRTQPSMIQGETWTTATAVTQGLHSIPGGALKQAKVLSRQIEALSARIHQQKQQSTPIPASSLVDHRKPTWKADSRSLLRPASAPSRESADLRRQASATSVAHSDQGQVC